MEAMAYEWLLRRVYKCGRNRANGADADIYRKMERAHRSLDMPQIRSKENAEYEFRSTFSAVRNFVNEAVEEGIKQIKYQAETAEIEQLQKMNNALTFDFYDKARLDEIIGSADEIFHKYGLQGT